MESRRRRDDVGEWDEVVHVLRIARRADPRAIGSIVSEIGATSRPTSICRETRLDDTDTFAELMIDDYWQSCACQMPNTKFNHFILGPRISHAKITVEKGEGVTRKG
jgi:hypothetical protein